MDTLSNWWSVQLRWARPMAPGHGWAKMYALLLVGCISASPATGCEQKIPWIHPHLFIWGCLPAYDCWQITELGSLGSMRPLRTPEDAILRHGKVWIWAPVKFVPPRNKHQICVKTPKISVKGLTTSIHFYLPAPKLGYFQPPSFVCLQRKFLVLAW